MILPLFLWFYPCFYDFTRFYDFSIRFWNCSARVVSFSKTIVLFLCFVALANTKPSDNAGLYEVINHKLDYDFYFYDFTPVSMILPLFLWFYPCFYDFSIRFCNCSARVVSFSITLLAISIKRGGPKVVSWVQTFSEMMRSCKVFY
jgi:low affinity Fe/Cu permease